MDAEKPVNRRNFFREGLRELLKPLSAAIEPLEQAAHQIGRLEAAVDANSILPTQPVRPRRVPLNLPLRPPGALLESQFLSTCTRGGECVRACPAQCIKIDPNGVIGGGAPYIDADVMPCVVCDSLACMHVCPSGALLPTIRNMIDMGTAIWHQDTCLRTTAREIESGSDCTICIDRCPIGSFAIDLANGRVNVKEQGCVGCGVCQHECPTDPKSIVVMPRSLENAGR